MCSFSSFHHLFLHYTVFKTCFSNDHHYPHYNVQFLQRSSLMFQQYLQAFPPTFHSVSLAVTSCFFSIYQLFFFSLQYCFSIFHQRFFHNSPAVSPCILKLFFQLSISLPLKVANFFLSTFTSCFTGVHPLLFQCSRAVFPGLMFAVLTMFTTIVFQVFTIAVFPVIVTQH